LPRIAVERVPNSERLVPQVVALQDHGIRLSAVRARNSSKNASRKRVRSTANFRSSCPPDRCIAGGLPHSAPRRKPRGTIDSTHPLPGRLALP
jgi:hypothetical protein